MDLSKLTMEIFTKLEQQWLCQHHHSTIKTLDNNIINIINKKTRILSIDGGGTSAIIAGTFLTHLEHEIQSKTGDSTVRIADFFDIIAGTGIGAILAVFLTASDDSNRPIFSAKRAVEFLIENRALMFKSKRSSIFRRGRSRRFSGESLDNVLKKALTKNGKLMTLKDTCKPILVPCYDLDTSAPFVFSRAAASASGWSNLDFDLWKVCRAAMATPSVFEPFRVTSVDGKTVFRAVDGGLVMNNPTSAAVTHVIHNKVDFPLVNGVEDLLVLSIGNGTLSNGNGNGNANGKVDGGDDKWLSSGSVVDIAVDGVSETIDQLLSNVFCWNRHDYVRVQANKFGGFEASTKEEILKEKGIESLTFGGKRLLEETNGQRIEEFVQRLIAASNKTSLPPSPYKILQPRLDGR